MYKAHHTMDKYTSNKSYIRSLKYSSLYLLRSSNIIRKTSLVC